MRNIFKSKTPTNKCLCKQSHFHPSKALALLYDELHAKMLELEKKDFEGDVSVELVKLFSNN